jgi:hypothetical protein
VFTILLVSVPFSSVKSIFEFPFWLGSISQENRQPASKPVQKYRFNKEQLYTTTYLYNKKENLGLLWK